MTKNDTLSSIFVISYVPCWVSRNRTLKHPLACFPQLSLYCMDPKLASCGPSQGTNLHKQAKAFGYCTVWYPNVTEHITRSLHFISICFRFQPRQQLHQNSPQACILYQKVSNSIMTQQKYPKKPEKINFRQNFRPHFYSSGLLIFESNSCLRSLGSPRLGRLYEPSFFLFYSYFMNLNYESKLWIQIIWI